MASAWQRTYNRRKDKQGETRRTWAGMTRSAQPFSEACNDVCKLGTAGEKF